MLIRGDARHLPLRDGCVDCVVTSPAYWGLRDYGTARWDGGDPACDHRQDAPHFNGPKQTLAQVSGHASQAERHNRRQCPKCGARRVDAQIGLEATPDAYVAELVAVFREVWRVLKPTGTVWLNLGDSYCTRSVRRDDGMRTVVKDFAGDAGLPKWSDYAARGRAKYSSALADEGLKDKDLVGIPWRVAFALQADGWYLRSDIIWHKPNPMPESVTDRPTKAHEYLFLLAKQERYYYDAKAIAEPYAETFQRRFNGSRTAKSGANGDRNDGNRAAIVLDLAARNKRSVWTVTTEPYSGAHFASFPEALIEPCILAGCPLGGLVLDPFVGSGTVGAVAERLGRRWVGVDLAYQDLARERTAQLGLRWTADAPDRPEKPPSAAQEAFWDANASKTRRTASRKTHARQNATEHVSVG